MFQKLCDKHPKSDSCDPIHIDKDDDFDEDMNILFKVDPQYIRKVLRKRNKLTKHGPDKLRYDHLQDLMGYGNIENQDEVKFTNYLADIVHLILTCKAPPTYYSYLRDTEIMAIPKSNGDVRPIGMGSTIRKLCSICALKVVQSSHFNNIPFMTSYFGDLQLGLQTKGTEQIIHSIRYLHEKHPQNDIFCMDGDNAFNRISRDKGLVQIKSHLPFLLPFISKIYGESSKAWFFGLKDGISYIDSVQGYQQGDVLASFMYCLTIHPFLQNLRDILGENGFVRFFIDDGNITGEFDVMVKAIQYIMDEGPKYGYVLNTSKGTYMMGTCSHETAIERILILKTLGLSESIIKLHPSTGNTDESTYGTTILGSYIGTKEFMKQKLLDDVKDIESTCDRIINVKSKQVRYFLLKWCYCQKLTYLQRTIPPVYLLSDIIPAYDSCKKKILASILEKHVDEIDDLKWYQACLPIQLSGLGLHFSTDSTYVAYTASYTDFIPCINKYLDNEFDINTVINSERDIQSLDNYLNSISYLCEYSDDMTLSNLHNIFAQYSDPLQHTINTKLKGKKYDIFKNEIMDMNYLSWITSCTNKYAGLWLEIAPKNQYFNMNNHEFMISITLRLYMKQNVIIPGTICTCAKNEHTTLDEYGIHLCTGCNYDGVRIKMHNTLRDRINTMIRSCGIYTVVEEKKVFNNYDPDNNKKMDITVLNAPTYKKNLLLDISITSPVSYAKSFKLSRDQAEKSMRAANRRYSAKIDTYYKFCEENGYGCVPIIFELSGSIHPDSLKFIENIVCNKPYVDECHVENFFRYWLSVFMFDIQKSVSHSIMLRCKNIYGKSYKMSYESSTKFIYNLLYLK